MAAACSPACKVFDSCKVSINPRHFLVPFRGSVLDLSPPSHCPHPSALLTPPWLHEDPQMGLLTLGERALQRRGGPGPPLFLDPCPGELKGHHHVFLDASLQPTRPTQGSMGSDDTSPPPNPRPWQLHGQQVIEGCCAVAPETERMQVRVSHRWRSPFIQRRKLR